MRRARALGARALLALAALAAAGGARELDPAACAARFDVQRDKIIRTEESREMGARYLSELDVGARAECLRLCCETDGCDVFVFEEKGAGSCYLFGCGPPEDFRCKFTAHGNFTSGVLALGRRLAELQDRERLAHHERELANLRSTPTSTAASPAPTARSTPPPPVKPPPPAEPPLLAEPPPPVRAPPPSPPSRCSRYQFACRRGDECVAVYNACDGVPQCADGSDEAAELGCPPPAPPAPPAPHARPAAEIRAQESGEESIAIARAEADAAEEGAEPWPRRLAQAQALRHAAPAASHIFSHTGGLLQAAAPWPPRIGAEPEPERWTAYGRPAWPDEPRRARPAAAAPEIPPYAPSKTMPELPLAYSSRQQTSRDGPKKGFELANDVEPPEIGEPAGRRPAAAPAGRGGQPGDAGPAPVETTTTGKPSKHTPPPARRGPGGAPGSPAAFLRALDEPDGLSERPAAAVLLLVLGSLLTAALGALLACRARAARRRRRAHPRLALDADYLVNGMYL